MHNNEEVLPHFILQLIHLFAVLPPETAFLSIYESGSTDNTGKLTVTTLLHAFSARKRSLFAECGSLVAATKCLYVQAGRYFCVRW